MNKTIAGLVSLVVVIATLAVAADWTGTRVGANAVIQDDVAGGIAIGDGATNSAAICNASGAAQIGKGTNSTANTIKYRDKYLVTTTSATPALDSASISAAQLTAGTAATAINGAAITNLGAANIVAGGAITAINGAAITNLSGANISSGHISLSRITNALAGWNGTATNNYILYVTNGIIVNAGL